MLINLLEETKETIISYDHTPEEIVFIGSPVTGHQCTWSEFCELANITYDNGYGAQEVANDLVIAFDDTSRLIRYAYDGSERWQYIEKISSTIPKLPINTLLGSGSLDEINNTY